MFPNDSLSRVRGCKFAEHDVFWYQMWQLWVQLSPWAVPSACDSAQLGEPPLSLAWKDHVIEQLRLQGLCTTFV
jgi:hypothetical protein